MNHFAMQTNAFAASREYLTYGDRKSPVLFPKPRRLGHLPSTEVDLPLWPQNIPHTESCGYKPGLEFLDYIHPKGGESLKMSPPFFCGSPPCRVENPVVLDTLFIEYKAVCPLPSLGLVGAAPAASPMSSRSFCNCTRKNIGLKTTIVRIEGFNCLDCGSYRGRSITAFA